MDSIKRQKRKIQNPQIEKTGITSVPAGLMRSKIIIRTEREREKQFLKLCSQIRLNDFKNERAELQRDERKTKRKKVKAD